MEGDTHHASNENADEAIVDSSETPQYVDKDVEKNQIRCAESDADAEKQFDVIVSETEPPDQGLQAWLVVLGVRSSSLLYSHALAKLTVSLHRRSAVILLRLVT